MTPRGRRLGARRALVALALGVALGAHHQPSSAHANLHATFPEPIPVSGVPEGTAISELTDERCRAILDAEGVSYRAYEGDSREDIRGDGILLEGPMNGVAFDYAGRSEVHAAMDCRLAVALLSWTSTLRHFGVVRLVHLSTFRPNARVAGSGRPSGHASALAFDLRFLDFEDGTRLDVLEDWTARRRGAEPCVHPEGEDGPSAVMRRVVCESIEDDLFQVVITPHHNAAHANHVHLEVRPGVTWRFAH